MTDIEKRERLYELLGPLPARNAAISSETLWIEEREGYILEKLLLTISDESSRSLFSEKIPAYFAKPKTAASSGGSAAGGDTAPADDAAAPAGLPAVLFCHSHGGYELGKDELIKGISYMYKVPYVEDLTRAGYAVLSFDFWCFGERRKDFHPEITSTHTSITESEVFKDMLWQGEVLWGHMVYDGLKAFDYLASRPEVDASRVASLGMSMGSTLSWWLAALEPKIKVCVDLCCLTDYDALAANNGFDLHGLYYFVPGLRREFTTSDINCLIAPRPHLGTVGFYDPLTPTPGVMKIEREVTAYYDTFGAEDHFRVLRYPVAHQETEVMRQDVMDFLEEYM